MKLFKISLILLTILIVHAQASHMKRQSPTGNEDDVGDIGDENQDDEDSNMSENIYIDDNLDNGDDEIKDLHTDAMKSRLATLDRKLCKEQSRYHPHYPKCQLYCENFNYLMGMCRRDTCHCYS
ncbi:uncharacterized protein LOC142225442 [Haematobia irritans]|uniref:uncharacterized protein LOC142225442 n=1 Tax=Haematobia irritans TaxID=7368 RepID=UPI003F4FDB3B